MKALTIIIWLILAGFAFRFSLQCLNAHDSVLNALGIVVAFMIGRYSYRSHCGLKIINYINNLTPKNKK